MTLATYRPETLPRPTPRYWVLLAALAVALAAAGALVAWRLGIVARRIGPTFRHEFTHVIWTLTVAQPVFYLGAAAILLLEYLFPVRRSQRLLSIGLAQDFVWVFFEAFFHAAILVSYAALLRALCRKYLGFMTIDAARAVPQWALLCLGVLLVDFLGWFHHYIRHRIYVFWLFHTVHHSQKELNLFTDLRYHVVEYMIANTVKVLPLAILGLKAPAIIGYVLAHQWYTRFVHGNIRWNMGWLAYILVTPQSHRVHHSPHRRHWDRNFGVVFSIWDWMFGTQYRKLDEFPRTGVPNKDFPHETSYHPVALLWTPVSQMIWPFAMIWRTGGRRPGHASTLPRPGQR
jgi:sterol desaturase/sphingolipid hydroxylase (fatty acid hydroxylase superfamily)